MRRNGSLKLLPLDALHKTGSVDHANWNYRPLLGTISRLRFKLVLSLLPEERVGRLLEIGYGSGIFMPELASRCVELYGIDVHQMPQQVAESLAVCSVKASLHAGSAAAMPFEDQFFDCIIAISALEFVDDLENACREIKRVLGPEGYLIAVTPGHSPLLDFGLKVMTGESAKKDYEDRRETLMPTLLRHFNIEKQLSSPALGGSVLRLYTALKLRSRA